MLHVLNIEFSRCTVLSQLMRIPLPALVTPRVLGVDDFALYGDTYGALLVDATTQLPLTLWEGRGAEQLSRWLRAHPGVEVACRDGSLTYRQGIANGAPKAVQVSDRFQLRQGLSRRVQEVAAAHRGCLPAVLSPVEACDRPSREEAAADHVVDTPAGRAGLHPLGADRDQDVSLVSATPQSGLRRREGGSDAEDVAEEDPGTPNAITDETSPDPQYAARRRAHGETAHRRFCDLNEDEGARPLIKPFPLDRSRRSSRATVCLQPRAKMAALPRESSFSTIKSVIDYEKLMRYLVILQASGPPCQNPAAQYCPPNLDSTESFTFYDALQPPLPALVWRPNFRQSITEPVVNTGTEGSVRQAHLISHARFRTVLRVPSVRIECQLRRHHT
ncbi:transposase [Streptomyces sp. GbtcB7]|uniref:transposase n=1 Tax=Streptomyces sp. GbtcB7 TaxID=2824752 RepID=UPI001C310F03|nr:transposase [Streptomyces sp. GbtcB7]